jgi:ElaB/YqjD/DUF883 family membrane-anchored ribosome-binding protein
MNTPAQKIESDMSQIVGHARELLEATADATEQNVKEVRTRLLGALDGGRTLVNRFRDRAASGTQACDLAMHENPYLATGVAVGVGVLLGYLAVRGSNHCRR